MQSIRRVPLQAKLAGRTLARRQPRRYAHDAHHDAHPAPAKESFGSGFYIALAAVPLAIFAFRSTASGPDSSSYFTRLIEGYTAKEQEWDRRNDLHTQAVELAGRDKALFFNGNSEVPRHVELRFPEALNNGSPYNVTAGQGHANVDDAIARYQRKNYEENAKRAQDLKDGNIRSEKPFDPLQR